MPSRGLPRGRGARRTRPEGVSEGVLDVPGASGPVDGGARESRNTVEGALGRTHRLEIVPAKDLGDGPAAEEGARWLQGTVATRSSCHRETVQPLSQCRRRPGYGLPSPGTRTARAVRARAGGERGDLRVRTSEAYPRSTLFAKSSNRSAGSGSEAMEYDRVRRGQVEGWGSVARGRRRSRIIDARTDPSAGGISLSNHG